MKVKANLIRLFAPTKPFFAPTTQRDWSRQTRPSTWAFHLNMMVMMMQYLLPQNHDNADKVGYENDNNDVDDSNEKDNDVITAICQPNMIDQDRPTATPRKALYMQG